MWKKAQVTMETILIYGIIAIVVLSGIGALIYFNVLDLGRYLPDKCAISVADLDCQQWVFEGGQDAQFGFMNNNNKPVTVRSVVLRQSEGINVFTGGTDECTITCNSVIDPKMTGACTQVGQCIPLAAYSGQKIKFDMIVEYQPSGGAIWQKTSGELSIKIQ